MYHLGYELPTSVSQKELEDIIINLNNDNDVDGMILQLPHPDHIDTQKLLSMVDPLKDVDGLSEINQIKLYKKSVSLNDKHKLFHEPCTPLGCIVLINESMGKD